MIPLWFWVIQVKKTKTIAPSWLSGRLNFSEKSIFLPLLCQFLKDEKWHSSHKFGKDLGYEILKRKSKRESAKK